MSRKPARIRTGLPAWILSLPLVWMLLFLVAPFAIAAKISLSRSALAQPPYEPSFDWSAGVADWMERATQFSFDAYAGLFADTIYLDAYLSSLRIAALSTLCALLIAYPFALSIAHAKGVLRPVLFVLAVAPFWTSFLIRVYAWIGILKNEGLLNGALMQLGLIDQPLVILNTEIAVHIGIVYSYLPFMILPLYANLEKMDWTLLEAAADLGCRPARAFWTITVPLALPGIVAGCSLVFIPAVGEFVIPDLLGGSDTVMIGKTLWVEFFQNRDWPLSSAVAVLLLLALVLPIVLLQRQRARLEAAR